MQTLQYTRALTQIVKELKVNELLGLLRQFTVRGPNANMEQGIKDQFSALMFSSRAGFERLGEESSTAKLLPNFGDRQSL